MDTLIPTAINLHKKSRLLEVQFSNDFSFKYPCEYLRVFSEGGERATMVPVSGKAAVNITELSPAGEDSIRIAFDDGFDNTLYSWEHLHELGVNYEQNWQAYLGALDSFGGDRGEAANSQNRDITVMYFIQLARISEQDSEALSVPASVTDVQSLLAWLQQRGEQWQEAFAWDKVQVTVNKNFAEAYTPIEDGDEVAIIPAPEA